MSKTTYPHLIITNMSFEDIEGLSSKCAETLGFSTEEAAAILELISETTIGPHATGTKDPGKRIKQLEYLIRKEINRKLHAITLGRYFKNQRIPRGLRIQLRPTLCKESKEFVRKWEAILNKCSLDLILLTIQELSKNLISLNTEIQEIEKELVDSLGKEEYDIILTDINSKLETYKTELEQNKVKKFKRDTYDYINEEVYTWMDKYGPIAPKKLHRYPPDHTSSSDSDAQRDSDAPIDETSSGSNRTTDPSTQTSMTPLFLGARPKEPAGGGGNPRTKPQTRLQLKKT